MIARTKAKGGEDSAVRGSRQATPNLSLSLQHLQVRLTNQSLKRFAGFDLEILFTDCYESLSISRITSVEGLLLQLSRHEIFNDNPQDFSHRRWQTTIVQK